MGQTHKRETRPRPFFEKERPKSFGAYLVDRPWRIWHFVGNRRESTDLKYILQHEIPSLNLGTLFSVSSIHDVTIFVFNFIHLLP